MRANIRQSGKLGALLLTGTVIGILLAIAGPALILPVALILLGWGYVRHDWRLSGLMLVSLSGFIVLVCAGTIIYASLVYPGSGGDMTGPVSYLIVCLVGCGLLWRSRRRPATGAFG